MYNKETVMPSRVAQTRRSKKSTRRSIRRSGKTIKRRSRGVRGGDGKHTNMVKLVGTGAVVAAGTLGVGVMLFNQNLRHKRNAEILAAIEGFKKIPKDDLLELLEMYRDDIPYDIFTQYIQRYFPQQDMICNRLYNSIIRKKVSIPKNLTVLFRKIKEPVPDNKKLSLVVSSMICWYVLDCSFVTFYLITFIKKQRPQGLYPNEQKFLKDNAIQVIALYFNNTSKETFRDAYKIKFETNAFFPCSQGSDGIEDWSFTCNESDYLFDILQTFVQTFVPQLTSDLRTCILMSAGNQKAAE
jgi:hypothetical protein